MRRLCSNQHNPLPNERCVLTKPFRAFACSCSNFTFRSSSTQSFRFDSLQTPAAPSSRAAYHQCILFGAAACPAVYDGGCAASSSRELSWLAKHHGGLVDATPGRAAANVQRGQLAWILWVASVDVGCFPIDGHASDAASGARCHRRGPTRARWRAQGRRGAHGSAYLCALRAR